jgi:hypothetical protein
MNRISQESVAGRYKSFDTELATDARLELALRQHQQLARKKTVLLEPAATAPLCLVLLVRIYFIAVSNGSWNKKGIDAGSTGRSS